MSTFLEFYEVMLKFVLFKLYHNANLKYPPAVHEGSLLSGGHLTAVALTTTATTGAKPRATPKPKDTAPLPIPAAAIVDADGE